MECHAARVLIDERVHGTLTAEEARRLDAHLRDCAECAADQRQLGKTLELVHGLRAVTPPAGALVGILSRIQSETQKGPAPMSTAPALAESSNVAPLKHSRRLRSAAPAFQPSRWRLVAVAMLMASALMVVAYGLGNGMVSEQGQKKAVAESPAVAAPHVSKNRGSIIPDPSGQNGDANGGFYDQDTGRSPVNEPMPPQKDGRYGNSSSSSSGGGGGESLGGDIERRKEADSPYDALTAGGPQDDGPFILEKPAAPPHVELGVNAQPHSRSTPYEPASPPPPPSLPEKVDKSDVKKLNSELDKAEEGKIEPAVALPANPSYTEDINTNGALSDPNTLSHRTYLLYPENWKLSTEKTPPGETPKGPYKTPAKEDTAPKIIKSGDLTLEVPNYADALKSVDAVIAKYKAQLADRRSFDQPGGTKSGFVIVRVAPERFEEAFSELKKFGNVLAERAGGQDITAAYTDTDARIKNLKVSEQRLLELIQSKTFLDKVASLLEVERELTRVRGEIESMEGQMRVWHDQLGLSTIRLTLQEPARQVPGGALSIEVQSLADAKKILDTALTASGAQLLNGQVNNRGDGTQQGTYKVSVKFPQFGGLLAAIKGLGRVNEERVANQPFTQGVPNGAEQVSCELDLVFFERSVQMPSGALALEVPALNESVASVTKLVEEKQGAVVSNQVVRNSDGSSTANLVVRVKAGNFAALLDAIPALGRLTQKHADGEGGAIRGSAAETPVNLSVRLFEPSKQIPAGSMLVTVEKFETARDAILALVKAQKAEVKDAKSASRNDGTWAGGFKLSVRADKMDELVRELEKLGSVKSRNIQGLGLGELSHIDPNVQGELIVNIEERSRTIPVEVDAAHSTLRETFGGLLTSLGIIVRGFGLMLPWLLLVALVYGIVRFMTRTPTPPPIPLVEIPKTAPASSASPKSDLPSDESAKDKK